MISLVHNQYASIRTKNLRMSHEIGFFHLRMCITHLISVIAVIFGILRSSDDQHITFLMSAHLVSSHHFVMSRSQSVLMRIIFDFVLNVGRMFQSFCTACIARKTCRIVCSARDSNKNLSIASSTNPSQSKNTRHSLVASSTICHRLGSGASFSHMSSHLGDTTRRWRKSTIHLRKKK